MMNKDPYPRAENFPSDRTDPRNVVGVEIEAAAAICSREPEDHWVKLIADVRDLRSAALYRNLAHELAPGQSFLVEPFGKYYVDPGPSAPMSLKAPTAPVELDHQNKMAFCSQAEDWGWLLLWKLALIHAPRLADTIYALGEERIKAITDWRK
jgi:hypothetical protein